MPLAEGDSLLDELRESCWGDHELTRLIDVLEREGRDDLLTLMWELRQPRGPRARAGMGPATADGMEQRLLELHDRFVPIAKAFGRVRKARRIYERWCLKENVFSIVKDQQWKLDESERQQYSRLATQTRVRPPVLFEELPDVLGADVECISGWIFEIHEHHLDLRRGAGAGVDPREDEP